MSKSCLKVLFVLLFLFLVAHMCTDVDIRGVQDLYLDAFVPAGSAVTCNCSLWATSLVQINIDHLQLPDTHCTSELDIQSNQWQESITFNCSGEITPLYLRYLDNESVHVKLRTERGQINSTYCISFSLTALSGRGICFKTETACCNRPRNLINGVVMLVVNLDITERQIEREKTEKI